MSKYKVYLVGPITGISYSESTDWRKEASNRLEPYEIECFSPLRYKEHLIGVKNLAHAYDHPLSTSKALFHRDIFDVRSSDLVLANFLDSKFASIGSVMEIMMAYQMQKPVVTIVTSDNVHNHPFVIEASSFVADTLELGLELTRKILTSKDVS